MKSEKTLRDYTTVPKQQKRIFKEFEILEIYEDFYLCGKFVEGKLLYKECFSKFDVDGVPPQKKVILRRYR